MTVLPGTTGRRRIYLLRHGHVDYFSEDVRAGKVGLTDVHLTPLGQDQARATGLALAGVSFDRLICSGLPRTAQTAEIVRDHQQAGAPEMEVRSDFREIGSGRPVGITSRGQLAALMAFHFETAAKPGARMMEDGEFFESAYERASAEIEHLLAEPGWHTALVVAHEGTNRILLGWATGNGLNAIQAFEQDLACINIIDVDMVPAEGGGVGTTIERKMIKAVNITPYNYTKHGMNLTSLEAIFEEV